MAKFRDKAGVEFDTPIGQEPTSGTPVTTADGKVGTWSGGHVHTSKQ